MEIRYKRPFLPTHATICDLFGVVCVLFFCLTFYVSERNAPFFSGLT